MLEIFQLGRYFVDYEHDCTYSLSSSDPDSLTIDYLLSSNELSSESEADILTKFRQLKLSYTINQGDPELRNLILKKIYNLSSKLSIKNVVVHVGAQEALYTVYNALLEEGDKVVVQLPNFQTNYAVPKSLGCVVTPVYVNLKNNKLEFDLTELEKVLDKSTKLFILTNPNNPTGYQLKLEEMERIVQLCTELDIWLLVDEVYRFDEFDPTLRLPSVVELFNKGISVSGLSKTVGLPGLKLGWTATTDLNLIDKINSTKDYLSLTNPAPSEFFAKIGLERMDKILDKNIQTINSNLKVLELFCNKFNKYFKLYTPQASPVALVEILVDNFDSKFFQVDASLKTKNDGKYGQDYGTKLSIKLSLEAKCFVAPAKFFDFKDSNRFDNFFRVGLGRSNFEVALKHLEEYLDRNL